MTEAWRDLPEPPARKPRGKPVIVTLAVGTQVFRVHRIDGDPTALNRRARPSREAGGRFDSLDGSYGYLYVGDSPATAVAETLCRELPLIGAARLVPWVRVARRAITQLEVAEDLHVLSLHGPDLSQVGAPLSLTKCGADGYGTTRRWAHALRRWLPRAQGFEYRPRHDEDGLAWVVFTDGALRPGGDPLPLASAQGLRVVRDVLHRHNATVE